MEDRDKTLLLLNFKAKRPVQSQPRSLGLGTCTSVLPETVSVWFMWVTWRFDPGRLRTSH